MKWAPGPAIAAFPIWSEGLDNAPAMLAAYRRKVAREEEQLQRRLTLHEGDMRCYDLPHRG